MRECFQEVRVDPESMNQIPAGAHGQKDFGDVDDERWMLKLLAEHKMAKAPVTTTTTTTTTKFEVYHEKAN